MKIKAISKSRYGGSYEYEKEFQIVKDNPRLRLRLGDIVQVSAACQSKYAKMQFGVVVERYRWVKYKGTIYRDYGATIMFLTGKKKGGLKKFSSCSMGQLSKDTRSCC